jgi:hypothetical protein
MAEDSQRELSALDISMAAIVSWSFDASSMECIAARSAARVDIPAEGDVPFLKSAAALWIIFFS